MPSTPHYAPPSASLNGPQLSDLGAAYRPPTVQVMLRRALPAEDLDLPEGAAVGPDPYVDYARRYKADGGVELTYKSDDTNGWHIFLRILAWCILMALGTWLVLQAFAARNGCRDLSSCAWTQDQINGGLVAFIVAGGTLALLMASPVLAMHTIEIRSDCLILDDTDVFWAAHMEARPAFVADEAGAQVLRGVYGTRHIEFLKLKPVDENDATPIVLANHIEEAFKQLWDAPQVYSGV